ncbi:biopolymer transport protein ExbD [Haloferula luteola]|uniref:Biopolymer transport protein ExbD n=1 Tax=Haloferula luteola TaxID=595692 RepID=A0A840UWC9_9BACT|nr:biopolymer transporter ExbD [Haloferula luteola]MBB5350035.1 biopolymer transport protein ExbD [Haloferula luteola]
MKLVSTLPERIGFLHAIPVLDLFTLLLLALLMGPTFLNQSGVQVEMPASQYQIPRNADARVITLTEGDPVVLWLGRERLSEQDLVARLKEQTGEGGPIPVAYIKTEQRIPAGVERRIAEQVLNAGFRVYLLGGAKTTEVP